MHATLSTQVSKKLLILVDVLISLKSVSVHWAKKLAKLAFSQGSKANKGSYGSLCCFWRVFYVALSMAGVLQPVMGWASCVAPNDVRERSGEYELVRLKQIYDGDTVELVDGRKVRFIGINTPETAKPDRPGEPLGKESTDTLKRLLEGHDSLLLKQGADRRDRYKRVLGHLFTLDGQNITEQLLVAGAGFQVVIPPNLWGVDCYLLAERSAAQAGRGVWGHPYHQVLPSSELAGLKGGFGRFSGEIERIASTKKLLWVDLKGGISLRFALVDAEYLQNERFKRLLRAAASDSVADLPVLQVRGWLLDRTNWGARMVEQVKNGQRKRWQVNVRHALQWDFVETRKISTETLQK